MEDSKESCISSWILEIFNFYVVEYWLKFYLNCHSTRENVCGGEGGGCDACVCNVCEPGGHWPRKGVWGCAALKTPFHSSPAARKGPISSKRVSSQDLLLRKFGNFSLNSLNFHPNFSSQAPIFGNFQLTSPRVWKFLTYKPPNLEIFRSTSPFSEANVSSQAPHFGNPGRTPLPEKSWVPPPRNVNLIIPSKKSEIYLELLHKSTAQI